MGEKEKGQGGGGGRQSRQAPQRIPERQSHPATTRASSPQGATVARSASAARAQPRGCKGLSPLHKKTKKSPPSPEGKSALRARAGGWGQKVSQRQDKGRAGGRQGRQAAPQGTAGAGRTSARRQMRKLSKQPQQQHLELHWLGNFTPQSFLRKILKTSCNLRRIVV